MLDGRTLCPRVVLVAVSLAIVLAAAVPAHAAPRRVTLDVACAQTPGGALRYAAAAADCRRGERVIDLAAGAPVYTCVHGRPAGVASIARQDPRGLVRLGRDGGCGRDLELVLPGAGARSFCVARPSGRLRYVRGGVACHRDTEFKAVLPRRSPVALRVACAVGPDGLLRFAETGVACRGAERVARFEAGAALTACVGRGGLLRVPAPGRGCGSDRTLVLPAPQDVVLCVHRGTGRVRLGPPACTADEFRVLLPGIVPPGNHAPVLAGIEPASLAYASGSGAVPVTATITVADADSAIASAQVWISSGLELAHDTLRFAGTTQIAGSYDPIAGVLTLTGRATPAAYEAALRSVTYEASAPTRTGVRAISFRADDGATLDHASGIVTRTIAVAHVNHAPVAADDTATTTERATTGIAVLGNDHDVDEDPLSVGAIDTTGTLGHVTAQPGGTVTYDPNGAFASLPQGATAHDSFAYTATDGTLSSGPATVSVTVTGVNDAPVVTAPSGPAHYTEGSAATPVDPGLTVDDADAGATIAGASVRITGGAPGDELLATDAGAIHSSWDAATATLTLSGVATPAEYRDVLRTVRFRSTSENPGAQARTVSFTATDAAATSAPATTGVTVTALNDPPVNSVPGPQSVDQGATLAISPAISVSDPDVGSDPLTVTLEVAHGTLLAGLGVGVARLTLAGPVADVNAQLATLTYTPAAGYSGPDTLTVTTDDGGHNGSGPGVDTDTVAIDVAAANQAPVNALPATVSTNEDTPVAVAAGVTDTDAGAAALRVTLDVAHGRLTLGGTAGLVFTRGDGTDDAGMTFTGSQSDLAAALSGLTYAPDANYAGADTLTMLTDDLGNTGAGGARTDTDSTAITVDAVNDAPVIVSPVAQTVAEDGALALSGGSAISVSDIDSPTVDVRLSAAHGTLTLSRTAGLTFSAGDGTDDRVADVSGTLADVNGALDGLSYAPDANFNGSESLAILAQDPGGLSDSVTVPITVTPVNDAPVLTVPAAQTVDEDTNLALAGISVADADAGSADLTLTLAATHGTLTVPAGGGVTGNGTGHVEVTGPLGTLSAALASLTYRGAQDYNGPDTVAVDVSDLGHDPAPAQTASASVPITVQAVNDAPVAANVTLTAIGNTTLVVDDLSDPPPANPPGPQTVSHTSLRGGATDPDGPGPPTIVPATGQATAQGGTVDVTASGDIVYHPPRGFTGTDSFAYQVDDGASANNLGSGTVTVNVPTIVWYVDASASAPPAATAGRSDAPLTSLTDLNGAGGSGDLDGPNARIFLYPGTYTGGLRLENGQQLLSMRHGLVDDAGGVFIEGPQPGPTSTVEGGVTLASGNTLQGIDLGTTGAAGVFALSGTSVGSATVNTVTSGGIDNPAGGAVRIDGTGNALNVTLARANSSGGSSNAIALGNASGRFDVQAGTIGGSAGPDVSLDGGTLDFTLSAAISDATGQVVSISNQSGGLKDFNGAIAGGSVAADTNTGATIRFDGGLQLSTGAADALAAVGGGTVAVTGAGNTLQTTSGGRALDVDNTAIHADGLTFRRISSSGAPSGIVLAGTGSAGGLAVTGTGAAGTGGTIQGSTGPGIWLSTAGGAVSLDRMSIANGGDDGIRAQGIGSLTVSNSSVTGNGNAGGEDGVEITNASGTLTFAGDDVGGSADSNLHVISNDSPAALVLNVTGGSYHDTTAATGNHGVLVEGNAGGRQTVSITGASFASNRGSHVQVTTDNSNAVTQDVTIATVSTSSPLGGGGTVHGGGLAITPGGGANVTATIRDSNLQTAVGDAVRIDTTSGSAANRTTAIVKASILRNQIGTSGSARSGSYNGDGIDVFANGQSTVTALVESNTVRQFSGHGVYLLQGDGRDAKLNATVRGNTIDEPSSTLNGGTTGVEARAGLTSVPADGSTADAGVMCLDLGGAQPNALSTGGTGAFGSGFEDIYVWQRFGARIQLPGLGGATTDAAARTYLESRNAAGGTPVAYTESTPVNTGFQSTASCPVP